MSGIASLKCRLRCSNVVTFLLATAVFVVIVVFFITRGNPAPAQCTVESNCAVDVFSNNVVADECHSSNCMLGYYLPDYGVCYPQTAPNGTNCVDACYIDEAETKCDEHGDCVGYFEECRGYCESDSDCNATIPLNPFWLPESGNWDEGLVLWGYKYLCFNSKCQLHTVDLYWRDHPINYGEPISAYHHCEDFLDLTWKSERLGCLFQEDFLLDTNLTNGYYPDDTPELVTQFRMCTFHYKCPTTLSPEPAPAPLPDEEKRRGLDSRARLPTVAEEILTAAAVARTQKKF